ncbi:uncharacterized protein LOC111875346 isoform X2 [Cryptotermes secundus]|uniref:uncharacterized protein LOC111875346 isoform X2 n=1 Tax=Cryptotermes secundus TaxID=105785 RepID=UPI001454D863|nr:uncharacterized protein LOC111875346 isoform X2 [Cryptotermes secundus]
MATSKYCDGGHYCSPPKECCTLGCCYMYIPGYRPPSVPPTTDIFSIVFWNHWYFWCLLVVFLVSCVGGCSLWRRWHCSCCCWRRGDPGGGSCDDEPSSGRESVTSCYPPPQYSRCSSFHHAPPPYTEVTSKPDLYPLVISYGDNGKGSTGGNYLMVQYFRNYIVRPVGSLSATSTADSLSSSFLCNAVNEANTIIPPPYSCAGSLDEFQTSTPLSTTLPPPPMLLRSVSSITSFSNHNIYASNSAENLSQTSSHQNISLLTMTQQQPITSRSPSCLSGDMQLQPGQQLLPDMLQHQQSFVSATALSTTGSDISSLAGVGTPGSPPRATSPTLEIRELLGKIQRLPFQQPIPLQEHCSDYCGPTLTDSQNNSRKKRYRSRGSGKNLYMPLGLGTVGSGSSSRSYKWLPRSAPTTPCTNYPPPFLASAVSPPRPASSSNRRRQSSGTAKEDGNPLLAEHVSDEENEQAGVM